MRGADLVAGGGGGGVVTAAEGKVEAVSYKYNGVPQSYSQQVVVCYYFDTFDTLGHNYLSPNCGVARNLVLRRIFLRHLDLTLLIYRVQIDATHLVILLQLCFTYSISARQEHANKQARSRMEMV